MTERTIEGCRGIEESKVKGTDGGERERGGRGWLNEYSDSFGKRQREKYKY